MLFLCSRELLKEKRRTSNKERKLGDTFFPTVFPGVILICGKKVRGGGLAWLAKENLGSIFREALCFCFQVLEGLTLGRQKKKKFLYFHKIETLEPAYNKRDVEETGGRTSHPLEPRHRLEFISVSYINKGGALSLKCVERILSSVDTGKSPRQRTC